MHHLFVEETDERQFYELPNLLLQCSVHEDRILEHYLTQAIDSILCECIQRLERHHASIRSRQHHTFLLPSLLDAVCSENDTSRKIGIEWIQKLLIKLDDEAAAYLASYLVQDEDEIVATLAKQIVSRSISTLDANMVDIVPVTFINLGTNDGILKLQDIFDRRVEVMSNAFDLPPEESAILSSS